jgi:NodT family efflux transporter outer membrane factor (OMF) lipoprotein
MDLVMSPPLKTSTAIQCLLRLDRHVRALRHPASLLMMVVATLCAGCVVGPDYQRPTLPTEARFTRAPLPTPLGDAASTDGAQHLQPGAGIAQDWWRVFASPALDALVARAFAHNPNVDSAQAALRQAQENVAAQKGAYFPTAQVSYSPSRQQNAVGTIAPTLSSGQPLYTLHTAQLSIAYAPDVFGLNRRSVESLQAQAEVQRFQLQATYITLATNVVLAAIQQAALRAQIEATYEIIDADSRSLALLQRQAVLGYASGLDVAAQETLLAQAQQNLPPLEKQQEQTRDLLAVLAGDPPSKSGEEDFDLTALQLPGSLPLSLPSQLVEQRPDVRAAEAEVKSANAEVGVAIANRLPQLSLSALYGGSAMHFSQMFADDNTFWGLAGNLSQTLLDFGTLKHRQRASEAAWLQTQAQYREVVLSAFQNVADALYALDADTRASTAATYAEASAKKTLDLTRKQQELGFVNALVLLNAEQAYQQTRIIRIQAQAARLGDTAALFQALGGGWQTAAEAGSGKSTSSSLHSVVESPIATVKPAE